MIKPGYVLFSVQGKYGDGRDGSAAAGGGGMSACLSVVLLHAFTV